MAGEFTTQDLTDLTEAIASGATSIRHGDKGITYSSPEAMLALRDRMIRELGGQTTHRPVRHLVRFDRGDRK